MEMQQRRDSVPVDMRIAQLAAGQHGVVGVRQLLALGLDHGAIGLRVRRGWLHRAHRGVYAVGHPRLSGKGRYMAAVLACGPGAVLSHRHAADVWDVRSSGAGSIHVTVPTGAGHSRREGIVVHRARALHPSDVTERDGIPLTSVARTLLDISGELAPGPLERAVERTVILRRFDRRAVQAVLTRRPNAKGAHALSALVARLDDEPQPTRSELEAVFKDLCDAHSLPRPEINARIEGLTVDFL